jgi:glycosyltransferase involved in cell wall biosynthesis
VGEGLPVPRGSGHDAGGNRQNMRIAINATCFSSSPSGAKNRFVGIYGQVFRRLPEWEFFIYEPKNCPMTDWFPTFSNIRFIPTNLPSNNFLERCIRGQFFWKRELKRVAPDIFEMFHFPLVKSPVGRTFLTIHDIRYVSLSELYSKFRGLVSQSTLRMAFAGADKLITPSHSSKAELLQLYPRSSISVLYNGVDPDSFSGPSDEDLLRVRKKYGLCERFLLSVGHLEKRKNYLRLLKAISILKKRDRNCFLVIIGNDGDDEDAILRQIRALSLSDNVLILKKVPDCEVRSLYRLCSLFVFPSVYEGFGIPILEAMAAQCPMVISDLPVFREITENQSLYFNPNNAESIATEIWNVLNSSVEQKRLIDYGVKRVRDFTYDKLAQRLENIYKQ